MGSQDERPVGEAALQRVIELAATLAAVDSFEQLASVMTSLGAPLVGASNCGIGVLLERENAIRVYQGPTATVGTGDIRLVDLDEVTPLTDCIREERNIMVQTAEQFATDYPRIAARIEPGEVTAMPTYLLASNGNTLGSCFFRFAGGAEVDADARRQMTLMVPFVAAAVRRMSDREALVDQTERLKQSNRDLDNFAAVVAHDLSAPVRRIGSFVQLIESELATPGPKVERYFGTVKNQIAHLNALLQDTLAYSQVMATGSGTTSVDLRALVAHVLSPMAAELEALGAEVTFQDLPVLDVERSLARQVVQNLVDNALKYRHDERAPHIRISAQQNDESDDGPRQWWTVRVCDNGIGIEPDRREEVFAMFARLHVSDDRPGTGVGLAFVKRVVERYGGKVWLEDGIDGGICVGLTLPGLTAPDVI